MPKITFEERPFGLPRTGSTPKFGFVIEAMADGRPIRTRRGHPAIASVSRAYKLDVETERPRLMADLSAILREEGLLDA